MPRLGIHARREDDQGKMKNERIIKDRRRNACYEARKKERVPLNGNVTCLTLIKIQAIERADIDASHT